MDYKTYSLETTNSCCHPGGYNGMNLKDANPFDRRQMKQHNPWCKNELILLDKELRCAARIQPLDVLLDNATRLAREDAIKKGLYNR